MFWQSKLRHFHSIPMTRKLVKEFPLLALALALMGIASPCAAQLVRPQPHPPGVPVPEIQEQAQVPVNAAPGSLPTSNSAADSGPISITFFTNKLCLGPIQTPWCQAVRLRRRARYSFP